MNEKRKTPLECVYAGPEVMEKRGGEQMDEERPEPPYPENRQDGEGPDNPIEDVYAGPEPDPGEEVPEPPASVYAAPGYFRRSSGRSGGRTGWIEKIRKFFGRK